MSFNGYRDVIKEGDSVILYLTITQIYSVKAQSKIINKKGILVDNVFQTNYGALKCVDLIGKYFGTKVMLSKGWGYVLQPTPELWTITLPHRTQIIYTPDISMIVLQLELTPDSVVIESGTGSGSLSHALIRAVKPHGHLYTFDFHEDRVKTATEEFSNHGFSEYVTVQHRDVCENGFGGHLDGKADAVFLDLPHPWFAISHALKSIKTTGGRLCSFSPCIEQVQKSCLVLLKLGFQEIQTMEVLQTQFSVQQRSIPIINLDFVKTEKKGTEEGKKERETSRVVASVPPLSLPGHTGYLTFATLPPVWARGLQRTLNEDDMSLEECDIFCN
ncbi:tRNA (adenine(58)-N(1))-methyltransferase catalytic subunit TRMT61A [Diorhabda carinulata]|uniref:tRNA (adenine(58)-N(1))-methyltransferase catalytic subunit TRMT61A n=1 Tax=Diorhabda carinulata TaxID=1163345 RepID=UPI0025A0AD3A|nr:tRNA (adenine(58)-N(1))-methyltransferase catalytic subunit TRMT61A [Diorhabda carinulata]